MVLSKTIAKIIVRTINEHKTKGLSKVTLEVNNTEAIVVWDREQGGYLPVFENNYNLVVLSRYNRSTLYNGKFSKYHEVHSLAAVFEFDSEEAIGAYYVSDKLLERILREYIYQDNNEVLINGTTINLEEATFLPSYDKESEIIVKYEAIYRSDNLITNLAEEIYKRAFYAIGKPVRLLKASKRWDFDEYEEVFQIFTYVIQASEQVHEDFEDYLLSVPNLILVRSEIQ